ncbi:hypothetical protein GIB67_025404 [Kingdonia uniflora]|uniref:Dynein light chain 1, cytoplasmic n=1 Tax=Kingdonia uniflora TaxID=39325 RepID=A0A7J7NCJ9_9MAGN|nr:hypothetical protein GIB67_025404 [Kingdonia uniflora]
MDTQERQKRGGFKNFYHNNIGNLTPDIHVVANAKKHVSRLWGLRKSKTQSKNVQEIRNGGFTEEVEEEERKKVMEVKKPVSISHVVMDVHNIPEARKSVSHVETNVTSVGSFLQVKVLAVDMPGYMQVHAFRCARRTYDSLEKYSSKYMAFNIKKGKLLRWRTFSFASCKQGMKLIRSQTPLTVKLSCTCSKEMGALVHKEFDRVYGPAWHCIVGSSFGSFVTHSTGCFIYFSMEKIVILVFKTKVQKALN